MSLVHLVAARIIASGEGSCHMITPSDLAMRSGPHPSRTVTGDIPSVTQRDTGGAVIKDYSGKVFPPRGGDAGRKENDHAPKIEDPPHGHRYQATAINGTAPRYHVENKQPGFRQFV